MKVLALVIFTVASASSLGSGPYLPSGWKPQGPAFYLPSEVQKPAENPLKDTILQETEASGSDALREYGPPKAEVSQDLTRQALPDAVTEQAFVVIEAKFTEEVNGVQEVNHLKAVEEVTVNAEAVTDAAVEAIKEEQAIEEAVTEAIEENTTAVEQSENIVQSKAIDVSVDETAEIQESTTESVETTTVVSFEAVDSEVRAAEAVDSSVESTQVEQVSQVQEVAAEVAQVRTAEEGVKNVVEALVNLDSEIKAQQIQTTEDAVEVKSVQVVGQEAPEGFLEYGPPGFTEYGPPQVELARSAVQTTEEEQKIENNETRRRRFSPKFRSARNQH